MGAVIGIDLGTSYSRAAVWRNGKAEMIPNEQGELATPSCVAFSGSERLVGADALAQAARNPAGTLLGAKRLLGGRCSDAAIQEEAKRWMLCGPVGPGERPLMQVTYRGTEHAVCAEQLAAAVLGKLRLSAAAHLGAEVTRAVISVPGHFGYAQRQAVRDAAAIAGLEVLRLVPDTLAACCDHMLKKSAKYSEHIVLVFDLGGGTCDASVISIDEEILEVKSMAGETHLGGADFDARLAEHFTQQFSRQHGADPSDSLRALRRLWREAGSVKCQLSMASVATIEVDALHEGIDFAATISRRQFEELSTDLFERCMWLVAKALEDADLDRSQVQEVLLLGGCSRIPRVQQLLGDFFGRQVPIRLLDPNTAVACGAAVQAAILTGENDEALQDPLMLPVQPKSLGVEGKDGSMYVIVPRNTTVPLLLKTDFKLPTGSQTVQVWEGEYSLARSNRLVGTLELPAQRPDDCVLAFDIDIDGKLRASLRVPTTTGGTDNHWQECPLRFTEAAARFSLADMLRMRVEEVMSWGAGATMHLDAGTLGQLHCPLSLQLMWDPVVAADGVSYERSAIQDWMAKRQAAGEALMSPVTGQLLEHQQLSPNGFMAGMKQSLDDVLRPR